VSALLNHPVYMQYDLAESLNVFCDTCVAKVMNIKEMEAFAELIG
jgi:hypothetical protein